MHTAGTADVHLTGCRVLRGAEHGIHAVEQSRVTLTDCDLRDLTMTGLHAGDRATLTATGCTIADVATGIRIASSEPADLRQCAVLRPREVGIEVVTGGALTLAGGRVTDAGAAGIVVDTAATVRVDRHRHHRRRRVGSGRLDRARPHVEGLRVDGVAKNGIYVAPGAGGQYARCDVTGTKFAGLHVGADADPAFQDCRIPDTSTEPGSRATFSQCTIGDALLAPALSTNTLDAPDVPDESLDDLLGELAELVGLDRVKRDVSTLVKLMQTVRAPGGGRPARPAAEPAPRLRRARELQQTARRGTRTPPAPTTVGTWADVLWWRA